MIAFIDDGIDPYHTVFRDPTADAAAVVGFVDTATGRPPTEVHLSLNASNYETARRADNATWSSLKPGVLYHFTGTRVLALNLEPIDIRTIIDGSSHGTTTAGLAEDHSRDGNEGAWILFVVAARSEGNTPYLADHRVLNPLLVKAMRWIADQPWVDFTSLSFGVPGSPPTPTDSDFAQAQLSATRHGKMVFAAAGNEGEVVLADSYGNAPWVVAVSGADPRAHGKGAILANLPDIVANFTDPSPEAHTMDKYSVQVGTSLSAPLVAGELARVLYETRLAWHYSGGIRDGALAISPNGTRLTNWKLREAMNASAAYWGPDGWDPTYHPVNETLDPENIADNLFATTEPVNPIAPYAQMGWGYFDHAQANDVLARVLKNDYALLPEKQPGAAQFMQAAFAAREAYWSAWT
ncbi:MAG: S8/S53 family peptidase [Thermoplasmatota archaeon]